LKSASNLAAAYQAAQARYRQNRKGDHVAEVAEQRLAPPQREQWRTQALLRRLLGASLGANVRQRTPLMPRSGLLESVSALVAHYRRRL
jgi:hypothetical protein